MKIWESPWNWEEFEMALIAISFKQGEMKTLLDNV